MESIESAINALGKGLGLIWLLPAGDSRQRDQSISL